MPRRLKQRAALRTGSRPGLKSRRSIVRPASTAQNHHSRVLKKGKRGEHVHAYVDGEMAGMFKSQKGTLTGIKPGAHTLELRVATEDHNTELDATDKVLFTVK